MDRSEWYVAIVFALAALLAIPLFAESVVAQSPQPTVYRLTETPGGVRVFWFETDRDECYLYGSGGISCLRKAQP